MGDTQEKLKAKILQVSKQRPREVKWSAWVTKPAGGGIKIKLGSSETQLPYTEVSNHHAGSRPSQNWSLCPNPEPGAGEAVVGMAEKLGSVPGQQPTS